MPNLPAVIYALLLATAWPLYDYFFDWPRFLRNLQAHPQEARSHEYRSAILLQWVLAGFAVLFWLRAGVSWPLPYLTLPGGWRLWTSVGFLLLFAGLQTRNVLKAMRSERTREYIRTHTAHAAPLLPATSNELLGFLGLSLTAGLCEEFLFRGYLVWALTPLLTLWGAAIFSIIAFGVVHAYQGRKGMIQATVMGALLTLIVFATRSVVPAMALHAMLDAGSGLMVWISKRGRQLPPEAAL